MRRLLPDTLVGRTLAIIFLALLASQLVSSLVYRANAPDSTATRREPGLAERIAIVRRSIADEPSERRQSAAAALSGRIVRVQWSITPFVTAPADETLLALEQRLGGLQPELAAGELRANYAGAKDSPPDNPLDHALLLSSRIEDGSWVNFVVVPPETPPLFSARFIMAIMAMSVATLAMSILLAWTLTKPFRDLERASLRLGVDTAAPGLPVSGPREVRNTTRAFNEMQDRIRRLIADRTQMLAAISHDLRNPITTLRLRSEFVEDDALREKIVADLDEMEEMVSATLAFMRDDFHEEEARVTDIATILETVCDMLSDLGKDVRCEVSAAPLRCRPLSLKRAFRNLIDNAVKHGRRVEVRLSAEASHYRVEVTDDGPGLPDSELEAVFAPFYRRDQARSRHTGGFGLGLTVARAIIRSHGGDVALGNRREGGLEATVTLPRTPAV